MFDEDTGTIFRDVVTLALMGFVALVVLMLPHINPPTQAAEDSPIDAPGSVIFDMVWPPQMTSDVDLWVGAPGQPPVGYSNKGGTVCDLLRDDLGSPGDTLKINHEILLCRGITTGKDYAVNVHLYRRDVTDPLPIPVQVKVTVRNADGKTRVIYSGTVTLEHFGHEVTAARFELRESGDLVPGSLHRLFKPLRAAARS